MSDEPAPLSSSQKAKGSFSSLVSQGSRKGFAKLPPGNELSRNKSIQSLKNGIDTKLKSVITALEDTDSDGKKSIIATIEHIRIRSLYIMERTLIGKLYSALLLFLSLFSSCQYIYSTYSTGDQILDDLQSEWFGTIELVLACLFLTDWVLNFFLAEQKLQFLSSFFSLVDLMTVVPKFATLNQECPSLADAIPAKKVVLYVLCGMGTTRVLRALRIRKRILLIEDEVKRFMSDMILRIIILIIFSAAVMQYLEVSVQPYTFDVWTYGMVVTVATVGYGDISPKTTLGRFAVMMIISFSIITIPKMTNELIEKMNEQSVYSRALYVQKGRNSQHVVICGDLSSTSLRELFSELFHEDHDARNLHAVILQSEPPSYEIMNILKDPHYALSVIFLEGDPLHEKDLARAVAHDAKAIFIMTNKFSWNPDEEDAKTILQQFTIQKYLRLRSTPSDDYRSGTGKGDSESSKTLFCMQLIRPENKRHLVTGTDSNLQRVSSHVVVCLNEIKMGVIAKAAVYPGANTLIMNLLSSFSDEDGDDDAQSLKNLDGHGIETLDDDEHSDWLGEYRRGCDWEIYVTDLSTQFEGKTFIVLSELLYMNYDIILFALEVEDLRNERSEKKILLNPADFVIPPKEDFKIQAFVIAKNKAQSDLSFSKDSTANEANPKSAKINHIPLLATMASGIANSVPLINHRRIHGVVPAAASMDEEKDFENGKHSNNTQAWQELLKKYDGQKSAQSIQEELQKTEDKYLKENFYIRDSVANLKDAIINTSVMDELRFVDNHIIIIGKGLSNLYDLIRPLRSRHLGVLQHIVILYPKDFPLSVWQRISLFESIWIIRGSALEEADIRRAGIFKAKQVVVLADASDSLRNDQQAYSKPGSKKGIDALVDADAIFCYQCVRKMNEQAHVVVEIVLHTNVGYLDPESRLNSGDVDYKFTPEFASGALFSTSLLDTLVCQAFYNVKIMEVVNKLIGSVDNREEFERRQKRTKVSPTKSGSPGHMSYKAPTMRSSSLYQISIPEGLESRTYGALFQLLCRRKQIPLGLLRGTFPHTNTGPKANKMPYVFTNPPRDTELFTCDKVFVLSPDPIRLKVNKKDDLREMHDYEARRKANLKIADDTIQIVRQLRDDVKIMIEKQMATEEKAKHMASEFDKKFEAMMNVIRDTSSGQTGVRPISAGGSFSPEFSGPRRFSHDSGRSSGSNAAMLNVVSAVANTNNSSSSKGGGGKGSNLSRVRSSSHER